MNENEICVQLNLCLCFNSPYRLVNGRLVNAVFNN